LLGTWFRRSRLLFLSDCEVNCVSDLVSSGCGRNLLRCPCRFDEGLWTLFAFFLFAGVLHYRFILVLSSYVMRVITIPLPTHCKIFREQ
jgi:hypothetical protein